MLPGSFRVSLMQAVAAAMKSARFRLYGQGGDDIDHGFLPPRFLWPGGFRT
jgi:hypothetical protein